MTGVEGTGKPSTDFKAPVSSGNKEALSATAGSRPRQTGQSFGVAIFIEA